MSRLRSSRVKYPLVCTATCNPDPSSFLYEFVEFMLDDDKVPIRMDKYPTRYFVRNESGFHFYDTFEEANRQHPPTKSHGSPVKTYKFIPGMMSDLPQSVLYDNQGYISTLKQLPITEARRLLNGAWVHEQSSGFFKRDWVTMVDHPNVHATKRVRAWDIASSEPSESNPRVDATAGVLISKDDKRKVYTVEDVVTLRKRIHEVEKLIFETAERDTTSVVIAIPLDPGATAGAYSRDLARRLSERGFTVKLVRPEKGKIQRFLPFASVAEAGFVQIVRGDWNERYIHELETTQFNRKTHDDQADATSDAFYCLNRAFTMPTLSMSSLQSMTKPVTQSNFLNLGSGSNFRIPTYNNIN